MSTAKKQHEVENFRFHTVVSFDNSKNFAHVTSPLSATVLDILMVGIKNKMEHPVYYYKEINHNSWRWKLC